MKRGIIAILIVVALIGGYVLTGCGGGGGSSDSGVTITLMTLNEPDKEYFNVLADKFHEENPDITVKIVNAPYDDFDTKLQTTIASGTGPDIFTHQMIMGYMDFYSRDMIIDLEPYIEKYGYDPEALGVPEHVVEQSKVDGKMYGIPLCLFTSVMLYNKDLFDEAGVEYPPSDYEDTSWTFDAMIQTCKDLVAGTKDDDVYGVLWEWGGESMIQDPEYLAGMQLFNMDPDNPGLAISSNIEDPKIVDAFQRLADMAQNNIALSHSETEAMMGNTGDADPFLFGKIGMNVGGGWLLYSVEEADFNVGIAAIPIGANPNERAVMYTDPYFIAKDCEHPDEAFQFLLYLAQPENQRIMVEEGEGTPPASELALDALYDYFSEGIDPADLKNAIEGGLKYGVEDVEHLIAGSGQFHDLLENELFDMWEGKAKMKDIAPTVSDKIMAMIADVNSNIK